MNGWGGFWVGLALLLAARIVADAIITAGAR